MAYTCTLRTRRILIEAACAWSPAFEETRIAGVFASHSIASARG